MQAINYEISGCSLFFPWQYGGRHLQAMGQEKTLGGRCVHLIVGLAEILLPPFNYIIAIADRVLGGLKARVIPSGSSHVQSSPASRAAFPAGTTSTQLYAESSQTLEKVESLREFGIFRAEDLHALGVDEGDEIEVNLQALLREIAFPSMPPDFQELDAILTDLKIEGLDRHQIRNGFIQAVERLESHAQQLLASHLADQTGLQELMQQLKNFREQECGYMRRDWAPQLGQFKIFHARVKAAAVNLMYAPRLHSLTGRLKAHLELLLELDLNLGFSEQEKASLELLKGISASTLLTFPQAGQFQPLEKWKGFLERVQERVSKPRNTLHATALLKAYKNQRYILQAWRNLREMGIPDLVSYRQHHPDQGSSALLKIAETYSG